MKNFIAILLLAAMCFTLAACNNSDKADGSIQIQQITYSNGRDTATLTSKFYFEYTTEEIDASEYKTATEKLKKPYTSGRIEADGTVSNEIEFNFNNGERAEQLNDYVGKTYYYTVTEGEGYYGGEYIVYHKITYTALHISYLNVTFVNDDTFEVSYYNGYAKETETLRIKTDNYKMVYFNIAE